MTARPRIAVIFISDRPERYMELRQSALAGRAVHIWLDGDRRPPSWATGLHGDPTDASTYSALQGREAIVIVDLADTERAEAVARAVSHALPLPAVLLIDRQRGRRHAGVRNGITWIDEGKLLADAIELVLRRLSARKRVQGLKRALRGSKSCTFLVQNDPDPDAIASALALRRALRLEPEQSPIVSCGYVTRPENLRLLDELDVDVRHVDKEQLSELTPLVLVDVQPPYFKGTLPEVAAVVDHHPMTGEYRARYRDVRTWYGASATMTAEYLLAEEGATIDTPLATALLYGIMTDTKSLMRSASDEDLQMFAYLFPRADQAALRRIQHPSYGTQALKRFGEALQRARVHDGLAYVHLGRLPVDQEHIVAQLAEFCLGMEGAEISAVSGVFGKNLAMSTRALSPDARLGDRLRWAFLRYGSAGGHPVMAKTVVSLERWRADHPYRDDRGLERTILAALREAFADAARPRPRTRRRRRARAPSR